MTARLQMKQLPISERPYEKMERKGELHLSDAELLATILGTGSREENVVDLVKRVIHYAETETGCEGMAGLCKCSIEELTKIRGIGKVKAIRLKAVAELTKRMINNKCVKTRYVVNKPEDIAAKYMEEMRRHEKEVFKIVFLNTKNVVMKDTDVTSGTLYSSLIDPSVVFREAVRIACRSILCLHNHPSGDPSPSKDDLQTTERLMEAGKLIGIHILDHIIIGDGTFVSLKKNGNM